MKKESIISCGVDVKKYALECSICHFKASKIKEVFSVTIHGDTSKKGVWKKLTQLKKHLKVDVTCVDSGYKTERVYAYVKETPNTYALKGMVKHTNIKSTTNKDTMLILAHIASVKDAWTTVFTDEQAYAVVAYEARRLSIV